MVASQNINQACESCIGILLVGMQAYFICKAAIVRIMCSLAQVQPDLDPIWF